MDDGHSTAGVVVLVRHAEREFAADVEDSDQVLTPKGAQSVIRLGAALAARFAAEGVEVGAILTSPYARAVATAVGLAHALDLPPTVIQQWDVLAEEEAKEIAETIIRLTPIVAGSNKAVLIVGHKPGLAELGYKLCAEEVQLRKSEAAAIRITHTEPELVGVLEWQMHYKEGLTYQREHES